MNVRRPPTRPSRPQTTGPANLLPGSSTKIALGMGYTLMLKLVDRVRLSTGPEGTIVQLEKLFQAPPTDEEALILAALERF